jgi:hypothetical protein
MYGVEAQTVGLGGLAAQAPQDLYFGQALNANNETPLIGSPPRGGASVTLPYNDTYNNPPTALMTQSGSPVNGSATAATVPASAQQPHWSAVFDFHNSVAPWILITLLVLVGWLHLSAKANAGRRASAAVVL